jgi:signal transduction histidine kinase
VGRVGGCFTIPPLRLRPAPAAARRARPDRALREQAGRFSGELEVSVAAPEELPPLPAAVEVAAYRIAPEAMTNVARHAHARSCLLRLEVEHDLTVEVRDDGVGMPAGRLAGVGLPSMAARAAELGGHCAVARLDGGGTQVMAHLPLAAA